VLPYYKEILDTLKLAVTQHKIYKAKIKSKANKKYQNSLIIKIENKTIFLEKRTQLTLKCSYATSRRHAPTMPLGTFSRFT
jgi:hypothetical protein